MISKLAAQRRCSGKPCGNTKNWITAIPRRLLPETTVNQADGGRSTLPQPLLGQALRPASRRSGFRRTPARTGGPEPEDRVDFRLRFGIHSGNVVTGPTGCRAPLHSFKALGDSVIVADRLEEHGKTLRQDGADMILLSAETRRRAALPDEHFHSLGMTKLRGRQREVEIFRLASG